ncbi:TIGR03936 family radical SAM-associated protein [Candidatus Poriferisocius sp.]|uniref:TIGR03936 family radical SAM-associated protein n=1 Tax=Candidatus Poriferisocius sp. TaxID=3101276 RepID=UPI003B530176
MNPNEAPRTRVRLRYGKNGRIRFTSHRDMARIWERSLRRTGLPVAQTEGFSPRAKLHFGLALATGYESDAEYLDIDFKCAEVAVGDVLDALVSVLPDGIAATGGSVLAPGTMSLQQAVTSCDWDIELLGASADDLARWVDQVRGATTLMITRERKGKQITDDLAPQVHVLEVGEPTSRGVRLLATLGTQPRSARPSDLFAASELPYRPVLVRRTRQWIEQDGARLEPLEVGAAPAQRTLVGVQ